MSSLTCFYAPETELHDPRFWMNRGRPSLNKELPARAHRLLAGLAKAGLSTQVPPKSRRASMFEIHSENYLQFLETAWQEWQKLPDAGPEVVANVHPQKLSQHYPAHIVGRAGWHMGDTSCPIGPHSWHAALRAVDTALAAATTVMARGGSTYALCRPPGHHANADSGAGHCLLNNAAIAAQSLRSTFARVAVLDIDVHHGNGTQEIFYQRSDILTVSVHADPDRFYPFYLGYADETGSGDGAGFNLNIPLAHGSANAIWLSAIEQALSAIAQFRAEVLVLSLGFDAHERDPLSAMSVTTEGFSQAAKLIAAAGLPTVIVQEGGYLSEDLTTNAHAFMSSWCTSFPAENHE